MGSKKYFLIVVCLSVIGIVALTMVASTASAQEKACVFIKVGAGFSGKMRVVSGSWSSPWSSDFPIGSQRCQQLKNLAAGAPYSVQIKADLGETKTCSPENLPYNPRDPGTANFFAWGTTLSVKCSQDSSVGTK